MGVMRLAVLSASKHATQRCRKPRQCLDTIATQRKAPEHHRGLRGLREMRGACRLEKITARQLAVQRRARDAERAGRLRAVAAQLDQGLLDQFALHIGKHG